MIYIEIFVYLYLKSIKKYKNTKKFKQWQLIVNNYTSP